MADSSSTTCKMETSYFTVNIISRDARTRKMCRISSSSSKRRIKHENECKEDQINDQHQLNTLNHCEHWWICASELLCLPRKKIQPRCWMHRQCKNWTGFGLSNHGPVDKNMEQKINQYCDIHLINALLWPVTTYGCEAWTWRKKRHIQAFENKYRIILGIICTYV